MEKILPANSFLKETVPTIVMLYVNMKVMVLSPDGDTNFFGMKSFKGETFATCMLIICRGYVLWISIDLIKESSFPLKKTRSRKYTTETMTDTDYTDDLVLHSNTPAQAESLLYSLEQAAWGIGISVNATYRQLIEIWFIFSCLFFYSSWIFFCSFGLVFVLWFCFALFLEFFLLFVGFFSYFLLPFFFLLPIFYHFYWKLVMIFARNSLR